MKPFLEFFTEQAAQPQTHAGVQGKSVTITNQADGTKWAENATITQITPDTEADVYNLNMTDGNTIQVKLTPDQTHGITHGKEVTAVHDGFEFFFGKSADKGQVTEAYAQELAKMDTMIGTALGVGKSRKSGRTEYEYSGIPGHGKAVTVNFGGEDDPYVIVTVGGKEQDISKGKTMAADIAKFLGVKPVKEATSHRSLGQQGMYDITDVGRPSAGQLIDYYDRNGDKRQGKVKSVNAQNIMTLVDTGTKQTVKLTLIKP